MAQYFSLILPDNYFWYSLSILISGVLIWIIQRYIQKTERLLERLVNEVNDLKALTKLHNHRLDDIEKNIADEIVMKIKAIMRPPRR